MSVKSLMLYCLLILASSILSRSFAQETVKLQKLSRDADVILTGKVARQESVWNRDKTRIITYTTIKAEEYLKGNINNDQLVVSHPGGEVDGVGELYSHMPSFNTEEEVLLFVKKDNNDMNYKVLNGEEGKLTLYRDKNGELLTPFNTKLSSLKNVIKSYVKNQ